MEFLETHPATFFIGIMILWAWYSFFKIANRKDKAELAVAEIASKEEWSTYQELTIGRQTNIDSALHRIEIGLSIIMVLLLVIAFKEII